MKNTIKKINIYVGDITYMMNSDLTFKNGVTQQRYQNYTLVRLQLILAFILIISAFTTILSTHMLLIKIISLALHALCYYLYSKKYTWKYLRIVASAICIIHKIALMHKYKFDSFVFFNGLSTIVSILLTSSWYAHGIIELTESLSINLICHCTNLWEFGYFIYCTVLSTVIAGFAERILKEGWVLYDTYKHSYKAFKKIVEQLSQSIVIMDKQGYITYTNSAAKTSINFKSDIKNANISTKRKTNSRSKIINSIQTESKQQFENELKEINIKPCHMNVPILTHGRQEKYVEYEVDMKPCSWKSGHAILFIAHSVDSYKGKIK